MEKGEILKKEEGLSIVRLRGSPYEIGYQHGRIFKEEINWLRASALKSLCEQEGKIIGRLAFPLSCLMAKRMGKFIPQKFREEFNGIADGAKVDYNFLLLANFVEEISSMHHHHLRHLKIFSSSGKKCSCFVIKGKDGIILGRNLDYPLLTESLPSLNVLFVFLPQQGNPFLSLAWPGMVGVVTGISKKLNLILLSSAAKNWTWKGIPEEILARQVIQEKKDLTEAEKRILESQITLGQNLVLVSKEEAKAMELSPNKKAVRVLGKDNCLTVTNHFQNEEMTEEQASFIPKPKRTVLPDSFFTLKASQARNEKLRELCFGEEMDTKRARKILDEVSTPGTVQSLVFLPQKGELWLAKNDKPPVTQGKWSKFFLKDLLED